MPQADPRPLHRRWLFALLAVILIATFLGLGLQERLSWEELRHQRGELAKLVEAHPLLSPLGFFLLYAIVTGLFVPAGPTLSVLAGAIFGRLFGILIVSCASTSGACLSFLLSRHLLGDYVQRRWGERLAPLYRGIARDGIWYLFALRLSPLIPFTLINLGMGLTRMPLRTFWWVSQVGMLPIAFLFVNAGAELRLVERPEDVLSPTLIVSLSLAALVPLLLRWLWTRRRTYDRASEAP